jgi:hypothetical protein
MSHTLKEKLNNIERLTQGVVLSNELLCLQPNIFNRILLGIIRSKANASDFPVGLIESLIDQFEVLFDLLSAMIRGSIPNQGNATVRTLAQQVVEKGNGALAIASFRGLNQALLRINIDGSIVSLLAACVGDGNLNPFVCFAPHIPTSVPPQPRALILKQDHPLARDDLMPMRR